MNKKIVFTNNDADKMYYRLTKSLGNTNYDKKFDDILSFISISPKCILEIGCANGWRLEKLRKKYNANCYGIEPSKLAVNEGKQKHPEINFYDGTANQLPFENHKFDLIIFGFCLYLCDPIDYFKIAYENDRVLMNSGNIIIFDFNSPFAYQNAYKHNNQINIFKMDYSKMFSWNPFYTVMISYLFSLDESKSFDDIDNRLAVHVLKKNIKTGFVINPFK